MLRKNWLKLVIALALPQLAGFLGSIFTSAKIPTWYASLAKPFFSPPNWLFGPVWITLYLLMGISLYLVWVKKAEKKKALWLFGVQLALNAVWSPVFFGMQNIMLAFVVIVFLWLAIILTIIYFYKVSKKAAYLMLPYIIWVSFAAVLNLALWLLN